MENVFMKNKDHSVFSWENLGNVKEGRGGLGETMPVLVYRLMQFTMLDVLSREHGKDKANQYLRESGHLAGMEFTKNVLKDMSLPLDNFIANLQKVLMDLKIGILRIESIDENTGEMIMTVAEDLDCSGIPITGENVCSYDEGFIAGILQVYTGKSYVAREIDCWASGERVCRFKCTIES